MGQAVIDPAHLVDLARSLRRFAREATDPCSAERLFRAAAELEARATHLSGSAADDLQSQNWDDIPKSWSS